MKRSIFLLLSIISFNTLALTSPLFSEDKYGQSSIEGEVQKAITIQVYKGVQHFCALYLQNEFNEQIVIIEDITDCFYTRSYRNHIGENIVIDGPMGVLDPIIDEELIRNFPQSENTTFYFSDPE